MQYIYICYSFKDREKVEAFCKRLEEKGLKCWYVGRDGKNTAEARIDAIKKAGWVIFYLTENSNNDAECRCELRYAYRFFIKISVFAAEDIEPSSTLQYFVCDSRVFNEATLEHLEQLILKSNPRVYQPKLTIPKSEPIIDESESWFTDAEPDAYPYTPEPKPSLLSRLLSKKKAPKPKEKRASFSVLSPRVTEPDSYEIINVYMFTEEHRKEVDKALQEMGGIGQETTKGGFLFQKNALVTMRLESEDVEIKDATETQEWNGELLHFDFQFYIPGDYEKKQIAFICYVEGNGVPICRLNFIVRVAKAADRDMINARVAQQMFKKAFVSYSRKDEQRMLQRILSIHDLAPEMRFWIDKQSMDPGVLWRNEIKKAIMISDTFLLFWSVPASESEEVGKEWNFAYEKKDLHFISPVPLDPPEKCPPPDLLNDLNFNVRAFSKNEITEKLSFYDSDNIVLIKE